MTPRQKRFLIGLAIADIIVILVLVVLVTGSSGGPPSVPPIGGGGGRPPSRTHTPLPTHAHTPTRPLPHAPTRPQQTCQWQATQLLARTGLGGTVAPTSEDALRFEIDYTLAPGQTADEAAQLVWTAFDIALALQEEGQCAIFTQIEVTIVAHGSQTDTHISASVRMADLAALSAGELGEDQFIDLVTFTSSAIHKP